MGIEKLTGSLIGEANREAQEIVKTAQWHVEQMLKEEKSKEEGIRETARAEVEQRLREQRNERLAWARLEAKRVIAEAREDAITGNLEEFFSELKEERGSAAYKSFLDQSVREAVAELGGKATIRVSKQDEKALGKPQNCKVVTDLEGLGGAIVESEDRSVRIDLRLETLFDIRRDELRKHVHEGLFGKGKE
jgi:V/A-type H+-transporting ATPase subunit E